MSTSMAMYKNNQMLVTMGMKQVKLRIAPHSTADSVINVNVSGSKFKSHF